jgi:hypothetical protein
LPASLYLQRNRMHKYIFTDTNLFEQFAPITDIDWLTLAGCESATLLVSSVTIRELNKHKDGTTRGRLKRRAAAALSNLKRYSDCGTPASIRDGVKLDFRMREPLIDFTAYHLDKEDNDDRLVASALAFAMAEHLAGESVLVATGDFGLGLKVRAQPLLSLLSLPEGLRLPDEQDADERLVGELRAKVERLQSNLPNLKLSFAEDAAFTRVSISRPDRAGWDGVDSIVDRLRHPCITPFPNVPLGYDLYPASRSGCELYNQNLQHFFQRIAYRLAQSERIEDWYHLSFQLCLTLYNDGGSPAKNIDVELQFPPQVDVVNPINAPRMSDPPLLPIRPNDQIRPSVEIPQRPIPWEFPTPMVALDSRTRLPRIEKTDRGSSVAIRVPEVKHTYSLEMPQLAAHFRSYEEAGPFRFDYRIVADNHPEATEGSLNVVVEKN